MKKLFLLDASGFLFRSYFAIQNMTNAEGKSTNALFGFVRSFLKLVKDFEPEYLAAIFDGPDNAKSRTALYAHYKANRVTAPPDLGYQMVWAREFCDLAGIPKLDIAGVEADDTLGSVALWAAKEGAHVYLASSDKDLCQCVTENISILHTQKDNLLWGPKEVEENFHVTPSQIRDYLAIVGDSSDNVPGIPGFGPKTAADLLRQFGTLEEIYAHANELPDKKRDTLLQNRELAFLSKDLVTLHLEVPFPKEENFFKLKKPEEGALKNFYLHKNFHAFIREGDKKSHVVESVEYTLVDTEEDLLKLVTLLEKQKEICIDTETTDIHPLLAKLVGIGLGFEEKKSFYLPINGKLGREKILSALKPLLESPKIGFYGHNIKYDYHVLQNYQITIANISFDTIIASYVLEAQGRQHNLDALSLEHFGKVKIPISQLIGKGKNQISMWEVAIEEVKEYCCEDVDYTCRLKNLLDKQIKERGLEKVFFGMELPLVKVLAQMERIGIFIDIPYLKTLSNEVQLDITRVEEAIFSLAGEEFNLNSPKQLSNILFEKLGIKPLKKTTTGFSTNADVLETLRFDYPIVEHILEYRQLEKMRSTYIDALPEQVNPKTHRIHCTFNQSVAATGRLSSQEPNLQNIPIRSPLGKKIRAAFKPEKSDFSYLSADYSQIELRLVAHLSEDPTLLSAFQQGEDIHRHTAAKIFDIPIEQVTDEMRSGAKAVNFGIIYGQGEHGLSQQLGISRKEAGDFIKRYFERYTKVKGYVEESIEKARKTGVATTMGGRVRAIPEINSKNQMLKNAAERLAINTPLQGSAADLIKLAMLEVAKRVNPSYMILQIHDELLFEIPDEEVDTITPLVQEAMQTIWQLKVPLVVDVKVGKNWAKC